MKFRQKSLVEFRSVRPTPAEESRAKRKRQEDPLYHFYEANSEDSGARPRKKRRVEPDYEHKAKSKPRKSKPNKQEMVVDEKMKITYQIVRIDPKKSKKAKDVKIFDPEQHGRDVLRKAEVEAELKAIHEQFGQELEAEAPPPRARSLWDNLLKQMLEFHKQLAELREEKQRYSRKIVKQAQAASAKLMQAREMREREEEQRLRKKERGLARIVMKDFWGSVTRIKRYFSNLEESRAEKEVLQSRLEQMVERQLQLSNKIGKLMSEPTVKDSSLVEGRIIVELGPPFPTITNVVTVPQKPLLLKLDMRDYQLEGMKWIVTLHDRRMNGILADEMGLGKTIQTIGMLAHLAISRGIWGPHLIVVPSSIILNWEIEFKRWCPGFKILTYFGPPQVRKQKRKGWSQPNHFHVCITSYKLAVVDHVIFRRKRWYFMVLDEAHLIKNYSSLRWQVLASFNSRARLLLTGTPLHNDIAQLWSLLHFLMPQLFDSASDFNQWFSEPVRQALQRNKGISGEIVARLHSVMRPFFLRRLKKDVERQLPSKTESVIRCQLSRRQRYLYDQFIHLKSTVQSLNSRDTLGMMNTVMQLKKVCNHPDLFYPRLVNTSLVWPLQSCYYPPLCFLPPTDLRPWLGLLVLHRELYGPSDPDQLPCDRMKTLICVRLAEQFNETVARCSPHEVPYFRYQFSQRMKHLIYNLDLSSKRLQYSKMYGKSLSLVVKAKYPLLGIDVESRMQALLLHPQLIFAVPKVLARTPILYGGRETQPPATWLRPLIETFHPVLLKLRLDFPSRSALLYDSGKLVKLMELLDRIRSRGSKVLIFTQMSRMLDIIEKILISRHLIYVRLDGSTRIEDRQRVVERFNNDPRVLAFISSTRAGGIGLNLTGADSVVFYETDWNPQMDRQAQDRCHRIGQTRDVRIYRLICESTIQENILLKSLQKRKVDQLVTEQGMFNFQGMGKTSMKDVLDGVFTDLNIGKLRGFEDEADQAEEQAEDEEQEHFEEAELPPLLRYGLRVVAQTSLTFEEEEEQIQEEIICQEQKAGQDSDNLNAMQPEEEEQAAESSSSKAAAVNEEQAQERLDALRSYVKHSKYIKEYYAL